MSTKQHEYWKQYNRWSPFYVFALFATVLPPLFLWIAFAIGMNNPQANIPTIAELVKQYPIAWGAVIVCSIGFLSWGIIIVREIILWFKSVKKKLHT